MTIDPEDPLAVAVTEAIQAGDLDRLRRLLAEHPGLATARLGDDRPGGMTRTLLLVATDWPGHFSNGPATVALLVEAGADVNARFGGGRHDETPLHWAASSDDVEVLDALLDLGADIEAPGAVIAGGTPPDRRRGVRAVAGRPPAGRARGQHHHRRRGHPRPPGPAGGLLHRHRPGPRRDQPRLLGRLPRRPARLRRVPAGTGRGGELGPALGAADPPGRGRPQRRRRPGPVAPHPGRQARRGPSRPAVGHRGVGGHGGARPRGDERFRRWFAKLNRAGANPRAAQTFLRALLGSTRAPRPPDGPGTDPGPASDRHPVHPHRARTLPGRAPPTGQTRRASRLRPDAGLGGAGARPGH